MVRIIEAAKILGKVKGTDRWFGLTYNMNLYRGCQHGCIYCDTRSECYGVGDLSDIRVKEGCIDKLEKELSGKRVKGTIGFGSMNDPYMPCEEEVRVTRKALELCAKYYFPVHIITKGTLVTRDIDLLKKISKQNYAAVSFTITTSDDRLSQIIEPGANISSERFEAMKKLSAEGIYTGITLMPLLPFINDKWENIEEIVMKGKEAGAKYIIAGFGVTLRDVQRAYYYKMIDHYFPGVKEKYINEFGNDYSCSIKNGTNLYTRFKKLCWENGIETKMKLYTGEEKLKLF